MPDPTPELRWLGDHHCGGPWQPEGWASPHPGVNAMNHSLVTDAPRLSLVSLINLPEQVKPVT